MERLGASLRAWNQENHGLWRILISYKSIHESKEKYQIYISPMIRRIHATMSKLDSVKLFHIYRRLNLSADELTKRGSNMSRGIVDINAEIFSCPVPWMKGNCFCSSPKSRLYPIRRKVLSYQWDTFYGGLIRRTDGSYCWRYNFIWYRWW